MAWRPDQSGWRLIQRDHSRVVHHAQAGDPYVLVIVRSIVLKGVGFEAPTGEVAALVAFGIVVVLLSAARFQKRLE